MHPDVLVLGVGAMGAATCAALAARGARVVGLERHRVGHDRGSSHGESRLIRQAYFESPDYVPLLRRSYTLWEALEARRRERLLFKVGLALFGPPGPGGIVGLSAASAAQHGVPVEHLDTTEARRWSDLRPPEGFVGLFEPGAGYLRVEAAVRASADDARAQGAVIHEGVEVHAWGAGASGVWVETDGGRLEAGRLVVTGGGWSGGLLAGLGLPLAVSRQVLVWMGPRVDDRGPCFGFDLPGGFFYGVPDLGRGVKVGLHVPGAPVEDASAVDRALHPADVAPLAAFVGAHLPGVEATPRDHAVCLYTMTPDGHPIIDHAPGLPNVTFAAGFSGHGFKLAPVVGEILAGLSLDGATPHPADLFRLRW